MARPLVKQLLLRQTVGDNREDIAVDERRVAGQLAGEGGFRPAFNFCRDDALLERHRFRVGFQPHRPDGDAQRLAGLAQHTA